MNYPTTYPENINTDALKVAYSRGWYHAHGISCHNVPTLGERLNLDGMGRITVDLDNVREVHQELCYDAEMSARDYSPCEITASWINEHGEGDEEKESAEELWGAYDQGVADSIAADLATYTDEDYTNA